MDYQYNLEETNQDKNDNQDNQYINRINTQFTNMNNQFSNMMKFKMINQALSYINIKTDNHNVDQFVNSIIHAIFFTLISLLITNIIVIPSFLKNLIKPYYYYVVNKIGNVYNIYFKKSSFTKTVEIMYITENKQLNDLYKAVYWYLTNTNDVNYINEKYLQYSCDQKSIISGNPEINKIINQYIEKKIVYKNHEITYSYSTDIITIYAEKDRKKENYKIKLMVTQNENSNEDIIEEFCKTCAIEYKTFLTGKVWSQQIYRNNGNEWKATPSNNYRKLDTIILKNDLKNKIKNDLQLFLNSEEWYQHRDIPYTRGYLFYGKPGTGKTSMIKGLSLFSKRHIHYLMLNNISNDEQLFELMNKINYKETVVVLEDIDAMINIVKSREKEKEKEEESKEEEKESKREDKRERKKDKSSITLSGLLNIIDGVFSCHGRILIMTTNHPEVLDNALVRPGRIDCKFLFDNCNKKQIGELYEMFFNQPINEKHNIQLNKYENINYSPAHITSIFLRYRNEPDIVLEKLDEE